MNKPEQITEEELEAWSDTKHAGYMMDTLPDLALEMMLRLIAEVRRLREDVEHAEAIAMGAERRAEGLQAKIEEQRKAIERLNQLRKFVTLKRLQEVGLTVLPGGFS